MRIHFIVAAEICDSSIYYIASTAEDQYRVESFLSKFADKPIALLQPDPSWPSERWGRVTRWLQEQGRRVVLVGEKGDARLILPDVDLRGLLSTGETGFAMMMSCLFVGAESTNLLLAQHQGSPVVEVREEAKVSLVTEAIEMVWKRETAEAPITPHGSPS